VGTPRPARSLAHFSPVPSWLICARRPRDARDPKRREVSAICVAISCGLPSPLSRAVTTATKVDASAAEAACDGGRPVRSG
jgi:hypothetical protein